MKTAIHPSVVGKALRTWTSRPINMASPANRKAALEAAALLSRVPGQEFPDRGFRVFSVDVKKSRSWEDLLTSLNAHYPESCSLSLKGSMHFLRNAFTSKHHRSVTGALILRIETDEWLFNLPHLVKNLPASELVKEDSAGFNLKEYLRQQEVVAKPGAMARALKNGRVYLEGYSPPNEDVYWVRSTSPVRP